MTRKNTKIKHYRYDDRVEPLDIMDYKVVTVKDAPYYGCVEYGNKVIINVNKAIPVSRRVVTLIHEGLHILNGGWSHGKLHAMAVHIFSMPEASSSELALMSKSNIDASTLSAVKRFVKKHIKKAI